ncbi:MAG: hypothetical protein C0467_29245 [Planctomycetaceae bacterium]|nr:hypothetical protein [Planctomycetaceae bacterium]
MIVLRPMNLRWINGAADDPLDLCAHGDIEFRIRDDVLLGGASGRDVTVSAAGLYLLRTLSVPHSHATPVGEHLFPCCGHCLYDIAGKSDVVIQGCPNGEDFEVLHQASGEGVVIRAADGRVWPVGWPEWRAAVFGFADCVSDFYAACSSKQPAADDAAGYAKFVAEWERRRSQQTGLTSRRA